MKPSWTARRSLAARWGGGAAGLIRPGAEAVLLAGVAIGCAQIGWRVASPDTPAFPISRGDGPVPGAVETATGSSSPFAPFGDVDAGDQAPRADISGIRLVGLRMSPKSEQSGAVLILGDGAQRSFLVGYEIAQGVRLEEVAANHIVVSIGDQRESLALERPTTRGPSLALALLGVPQDVPASQPVQVAAVATDGQAKAVSLPIGASSNTANWLMSTAGQVELRAGVPYGWRAASALPEAGVHAGDLILSVNGVGPNDGQTKLLSAARGPVTLVTERASGERVRLSLSSGISP